MAPLAPMVGTIDCGFIAIWPSAAATPQKQIEDDEAPVSAAVFDVVAEDPQVPHVPDDVRPAAVQEHRRDERRQVEVGRHDAVA